jgi:hypothetical protein
MFKFCRPQCVFCRVAHCCRPLPSIMAHSPVSPVPSVLGMINGRSVGMHKYVDGYQSELSRKSQLNGSWKRRYFVLNRTTLSIYENNTCSKLVGQEALTSDTVFYSIPGHSEDKRHLFYFTFGPDDVYFLSADTEDVKSDWLEALTDALHDGFKLVNQPALGIDPFYPTVDLRLSYQNETYHANNSNKLKPANTQEPPSVVLHRGREHSIYSLIMVDLDSVRVDKAVGHDYLHWATVNIEGVDIASGLEVLLGLCKGSRINPSC